MNIVLDVLRYLNEHGITLVKAAEATGVAQQNIKKSIGNNPKTSTLLALAEGLGVDPRDFFYDLDEDEEKENANSTEQIQEIDSYPTDAQVRDIDDHSIRIPAAHPPINTTTFCPHCGAKVRVGVVLLPEE